MIFAAGLGTRLRPLTNDRPKALVELCGKTLLHHHLHGLRAIGIRDIVINVHHFAPKVIAFIHHPQFNDLSIRVSDESDLLLDTGGGLLRAAPLLTDSDPFLLINVDIITNADLEQLIRAHQTSGSMVTLATNTRQSSRVLKVTQGGLLGGWANLATGQEIVARPAEALHNEAFCGIHVLSPKIVEHFSKKGAFPIIPEYLAIAARYPIVCQPIKADYWFDVGKPADLHEAEMFLSKSVG